MPEPRSARLWVLAALLAATLLPLTRFDHSLWSDEASSLWFARFAIADLLARLCDPHPPGYYLLLKAWLMGGEQEAWLRLPSLGAALLSVALVFRLGREWYGSGGATIAALLMALHPLQNWYAAEIRMYALAQMSGLALFWLGWRYFGGMRQGRATGWTGAVCYGLIGLAAFAVDYAVLLPYLALQLLWLAYNRPRPWTWVALQIAILLAGVFLWLTPAQRLALQHSYHAVFVAVQAQRLGLDITPTQANSLLRLVAVAAVGLGGVLAWGWSQQKLNFFKKFNFSSSLIPTLVLAVWLAVLLFSITPRLYSVKRQLILVLPFLALLVGYVLTRFPRSTTAMLAVLGLAITLWVLPAHQREPWRQVLGDLTAAVNSGSDVIWVDELAVPVFDYYTARPQEEGGGPMWSAWAGAALPDTQPSVGGAVWLLTAEGPYRTLQAFLPAPFLAAFELTYTRQEIGIGLYRYAPRLQPLDPEPAVPPLSQHTIWGLLLPSPLDTCQESTR